jgi:uncharacterized membrane protein YhaH (DUF805 family)
VILTNLAKGIRSNMKCNTPIDPGTKMALSGEALETALNDPNSLRCGYELSEDDMFCPSCGTQKGVSEFTQAQSTLWWEGRAARKEYWKKVLVGIGALIGIGAVVVLIADADKAFAIAIVLSFLLNFYLLPVSVRRLHDMGKSGLWMLGFAIGPLSMVCNGNSEIAGVLNGIGMIYNLLVGIPMGFVRGTKGPNKYGPDPLETK